MNFVVLYHMAAYISIIAGLFFLSINFFMREWFMKGGLLRKKYYGDDSRVIYVMICLFFILGGLAVLFSK